MPPVVAAVAAAAATVASAAAAIGTAIASLGTIGALVAKVVISVGLSYVTQALFGGPSGGGSAATGVRGAIASGGAVPQSFIAGRYCTAGSIVYAGVWGKDGDTPNAYLTTVVALSDLPVSGLAGLFVNDRHATYDTGETPVTQGYPITEYRVSGKDHLWVTFHDGSQTAVDSFLNTKFGSHPDFPYDTNMIGYGRAYAAVTALVNQSLFPSWPNYKFEIDGIKLYDQRLDSTAGGSGSHRFGTASTYELTSNPMVIAHNILRGIYYGAGWFYGLQDLNANRCPSSPWFAAMNECDTSVDDTDGNPEDQFRCGLEVTVDTPPADILDELLKSCNGRMAEIGGSYKPYAGAAGSSVYSFTDSDIIISQPQSFEMFPGEEKLANGIAAIYPEPAEGWGPRDAPLRTDAALVAEDDGRELIANVNYAAVPYKSQVQRLQTAALYEARKFRQHALVLPPSAYKLEPNDFVDWTSTKNGYSAKLFRVDAATDMRNLDVPVIISEVDPADYDFDTVSDYLAQTEQEIPPGTLPDPLSAPTNLTLGQSGGAVSLTWDAIVSPVLSGYDVLRADLGDVIGNATYMDRDRKARDFTTTALSAGNYTLFVRGLDIYGQAGDAASIDVTVASSGASAFNFTRVIASDYLDYNLSSDAIASGWDGTLPLVAAITVNSGIYVGASTTANAGMTIPSLPGGSTVSLTNLGYILGCGGAGGAGAYGGSAGNGHAGGLALLLQYATTIDNGSGVIGGGGGGGGGGKGPDFDNAGGGGGGGRGYDGGAGGGGSGGADDGEDGDKPSAGSGGASNGSGGSGGAGGGLGSAGSGGGGGGGSGGAAGAATSGAGTYATWSATGTRYGTVG
jgi:hypothetical protein